MLRATAQVGLRAGAARMAVASRQGWGVQAGSRRCWRWCRLNEMAVSLLCCAAKLVTRVLLLACKHICYITKATMTATPGAQPVLPVSAQVVAVVAVVALRGSAQRSLSSRQAHLPPLHLLPALPRQR